MKATMFFSTIILSIVFCLQINAQTENQGNKKRLAIISVDIKDLTIDKETMRNMVQLELEKANIYEVMDKYDVADIVKKNGLNVDNCFGKNCLVEAGKFLKADKMLTGNIERFGDKLIFILRLVDVASGKIEKTDVMEYINQQDQIQIMARLSVNNILGIENDKLLVDLLANFDQPITSSKTTLKLNGPRVGFTYSYGPAAERMMAPISDGGFNMYPVNCMIGYQFEKQFLSSGDFQALFELIPTLSGMESGLVIPSASAMLGFRFNKSGFEFGLGPVLRMTSMANGYYDSTNTWRLEKEMPLDKRFPLESRLDRRGDPTLSTGMVFAIGKTFRSGYLNMPVNVYYSPRKEGSIVGIVLGFNVANRPRFGADKK
ncbi:MAG: hypothetical protein CVU05_00690 [Bacteroidetes bacterium HGW-Bacteroidetes-21]|nr:MAG: hypothetical protein CVU05_00690 [Bacteroidetes bacterium HGW-Bacteroidetes-21]